MSVNRLHIIEQLHLEQIQLLEQELLYDNSKTSVT